MLWHKGSLIEDHLGNIRLSWISYRTLRLLLTALAMFAVNIGPLYPSTKGGSKGFGRRTQYTPAPIHYNAKAGR